MTGSTFGGGKISAMSTFATPTQGTADEDSAKDPLEQLCRRMEEREKFRDDLAKIERLVNETAQEANSLSQNLSLHKTDAIPVSVSAGGAASDDSRTGRSRAWARSVRA